MKRFHPLGAAGLRFRGAVRTAFLAGCVWHLMIPGWAEQTSSLPFIPKEDSVVLAHRPPRLVPSQEVELEQARKAFREQPDDSAKALALAAVLMQKGRTWAIRDLSAKPRLYCIPGCRRLLLRRKCSSSARTPPNSCTISNRR